MLEFKVRVMVIVRVRVTVRVRILVRNAVGGTSILSRRQFSSFVGCDGATELVSVPSES